MMAAQTAIFMARMRNAMARAPYRKQINSIGPSEQMQKGNTTFECDYEWVLDICDQCLKANITFWFKNTGSLFKRDSVVERINPFKQTGMAKELGINISDGKRLF